MATTVYGTDSANAAGREDIEQGALPADTAQGDAISGANLDKMDADDATSHAASGGAGKTNEASV